MKPPFSKKYAVLAEHLDSVNNSPDGINILRHEWLLILTFLEAHGYTVVTKNDAHSVAVESWCEDQSGECQCADQHIVNNDSSTRNP